MNVVSVRREATLTYPPEDKHSPDTRFPENPFPQTELGENQVYGLVRQCLRDAGTDAEHYGSAEWNPFGHWIQPGSRVFVLPNLVMNGRPGEPMEDFHGKCTHGSVLRPVLDYARIAVGDPALVSFGNAPLQACDYSRVAAETAMDAVARFYREQTGVDVGPCDLRAVVSRWGRYGALHERREQHPEDVVFVDLGSASLLDEFYRGPSHVEVRVMDYDRREIAEYHGLGKHVYAVHRRVLEASTIISVPKLKTHEKVGITCALKGTVGTIARKEGLPHHRKGGPHQTGDEYPRSTFMRNVASELADRATMLGTGFVSNTLRMGSKALYRTLRFGRSGVMGGAWHGNDTTWRMALDIARIARFARPDGSLAETPQRRHLVVVDGVVGGEGEGPLRPTGRPLGLVIFGSDPVWTDFACAYVMRMNPWAIPLLANATSEMRYAATAAALQDVRFLLNGEPVELMALAGVIERGFDSPKGWVGHVSLNDDAAALAVPAQPRHRLSST